ncbi:MAG: cobalt-precorrin 5A hydrolase [Firmicutes bacterium]|nr:cobalt-precorrin 5A hydrolase [Bacillota bacterium]
MKAVIFAYSRRGLETAKRVTEVLPDAEINAPQRLEGDGIGVLPKPSRPFYGACFSSAEALIFIGSCGIAVREIAPFVRDKRTDPAVVCIDELGRFVIPLLSGHIGGANALAGKLARALGATAVITTATDINQRFSVDAWAASEGYWISDLQTAKAVSAAILEGDVPLKSDFPIATPLPSGVVQGSRGDLGIYITFRRKEPFSKTLRLIPKVLHIGIGCRKGIRAENVETAVETVLSEHDLDVHAVKCAASIDRKQSEPGLLAFCQKHGWDVTFYTPEELRAVQGAFPPSEFVQSVTGVDNVCQRAAMLGAQTLLVEKTACDGVTIAVAAEHWEVRFGETVCSGHWSRGL